ncbi:double-CXXCG motif protein [Pyxidicoccus caerfyrddinensis]|uniref:SitI6 family double-CXXCG motif immunity protein n=1 Tax=Pyxidicoccus caerfyrddinensis TaxID=2709663 RepID=UPI0013DA4198|nr:double-CXXCG motif protein [Pyxidicoccus caerfyrddinensis]
MTSFYEITWSPEPTWSSTYRVSRRWHLPSVEQCPSCRATVGSFLTYPTVDLSELPEARELKPRPASFEEYVRLRDLVRPYCPPGAPLEPGTGLGPLGGSTRGKWGAFTLVDLAALFVREDALRALENLRGIVPVWPKFRRPPAPAVAELQLLPHGRLAPDCFPPGRREPCAVCGCDGEMRPLHYWADPASLPTDLDAFRLADYSGIIVVSERFASVVRRFEPNDITLKLLLTSRPPGIQTPKRLDGNAAIIIRR